MLHEPNAPAAAEPVDAISRAEILRRLDDPTLTPVDVLPRETFLAGRIPGSIGLPLGEIPERARRALPDPSQELAVYCAGPACPLALQAVGLLRSLGYTRVRSFIGGMAEWTEHGGPLERGTRGPRVARAPGPRSMTGMARSGGRLLALIDALAARSVGQLLSVWLGMSFGFGVLYWVAGLAGWGGVVERGAVEPGTLTGLLSAVYFSFVTAMSVGYGDALPIGPMRAVAIVEAIGGLLIFGFVIARFVSRRQEEVIDEIHRIAFEDRLGRVQTGLHLALSEMQAIVSTCGGGKAPPPRTLARAESAAMVFARELRTVHDLLYRPKSMLEEHTVEAILVTLTAALRELHDLVACLAGGADHPPVPRSPVFERSLGAIAQLGSEICGECVPRELAPALKEWLDQIQDLAQRLPGRS